jgi:ribokinase
VHAVHGGETRRAWTYVDQHGERTITVLGDKLLPRGPLPLAGYDAVFFVSGDVEALRSARAARLLAATLRERPTLSEGGVPLDLLVGSLNDAGERYDDSLDAKVVVLTDGGKGGTVNGERFAAAEPPGAISDAYGAGDSFAAALLVGLARGDDVAAAVRLGARAGAAVITGQGPYTAQLTS